MTNYNKIHLMNVEQLAEFLFYFNEDACKWINFPIITKDKDISITLIKHWLESEMGND